MDRLIANRINMLGDDFDLFGEDDQASLLDLLHDYLDDGAPLDPDDGLDPGIEVAVSSSWPCSPSTPTESSPEEDITAGPSEHDADSTSGSITSVGSLSAGPHDEEEEEDDEVDLFVDDSEETKLRMVETAHLDETADEETTGPTDEEDPNCTHDSADLSLSTTDEHLDIFVTGSMKRGHFA